MGPLDQAGKTDDTGTTITFLPDDEIFEETDYSFDTLSQRLREMAFLTRGLQIELIDERAGGETADFKYDGGIVDFITYVNEGKEPVHKDVIYFDNETDEGQVEVAMQWNQSYVESTFSFANNINTHEGGTHLSGFKASLTRTLNEYARNKGLLKEKEEPLTGDDCREGLAAIVSVKLREPQFEGQTKTKLGNPSIRSLVETSSNARLSEFLEEHPNEAKQIVNKLISASRARQAARKAPRRHPPQVGARRRRAARQAGRLLAARPRTRPSSTWSRATAPAAPPWTPATAASRPSCRCAARSSTSRRPASTRCSPTTRSRP